MAYKTIQKLTIGEFKNLNSKFIAYLYPFRAKAQLDDILLVLRKEHPKARHFCYAYRIGYEREEFRANDDGEPSGTAGKPILNQLYSFEIKNALIVVVRYFGGTKLGVPGLIEAYKEAAKSSLLMAEIVEDRELKEALLDIPESQYYTMIKLLKTNKIDVIESSYSQNKYQLSVRYDTSKHALIESFLQTKN